jgi:transposase
MERRLAQVEESVARYLSQLDTADLEEPSEALATRTAPAGMPEHVRVES